MFNKNIPYYRCCILCYLFMVGKANKSTLMIDALKYNQDTAQGWLTRLEPMILRYLWENKCNF